MMEQRRRRRSWSVEEKHRIVAEARAEGAKVAEVARRHGANANMVFKWLRDPAFGGAAAPAEFLAVEVASPTASANRVQGEPRPGRTASRANRVQGEPRALPSPPPPLLEHRPGIIEIDLACGSRVRVDAHVNERALARVLRILRAAG